VSVDLHAEITHIALDGQDGLVILTHGGIAALDLSVLESESADESPATSP
jgi:hypothetical protein